MRNEHRAGVALGVLGVTSLVAGLFARRRARDDLRGKTVVITGGGRGLGLSLARAFAAEGCTLFLAGRDVTTLDEARARLSEQGIAATVVPCDVTDSKQAQRLIRAAEDATGAVDVLVNNAGIIDCGPMEVMVREDFERAMQTHFWGAYNTISAALPKMRARGDGRIVNVSSIGGVLAVPHLLPYCASKFALRGLSEGLRVELGKEGIAVTTVCPGLMRTGSPRNASFKGEHRAEYAWFVLGASLPFTSMNADRAARQIVSATAHRRAHVILGWQAKLVALAHGVAPGVIEAMMAGMARLLPSAGGIGALSATGEQSQSPITRSFVTALDDRAAKANNELPSSYLVDRPSHA